MTGSIQEKIGTLAHNRAFTPSELTQYAGVDGPAVVRRLVRGGYLQRVSRGHYAPTRDGWAWIEGYYRRG